MKRFLSLLLLAALAVLSLCACPAEDEPYRFTSPAYNEFVCAETGVHYQRRLEEWLPNAILSQTYAVYANGNYETSFFAVKDASPEELLVERTDDGYYLYVLTAEGVSLPDVADFTPTDVIICDGSAEFYWLPANVLDRVAYDNDVYRVADAYRSGTVCTSLPGGTPAVRAELLLYTASYPLALHLTYRSFGTGETYLSENGTSHHVKVSDTLLDGYTLTAGE